MKFTFDVCFDFFDARQRRKCICMVYEIKIKMIESRYSIE